MAMAMNTPVNTRAQGISPPMTPSMTIFIIMAWGAPSSSEPKPQAAFSRYRMAPMAMAETHTPISSPYCCFLGVEPSRKPVFRS